LKLYYSPLSPFARKVRIVLAEKGLETEVEGVVVNPWDEPPELTGANPISQVPALALDDGRVLFDSSVVAHYLDSLNEKPRLIPAGEAQWGVRKTEAAANAICENVVKLRQESLRPEAERSASHTARWRRTVTRALDALEAEGPDAGFDLGEIMVVIALDYIDFREPGLDWRNGRPNLLARWKRLASRPSFRATAPA
jgi:glutathione S-transferase